MLKQVRRKFLALAQWLKLGHNSFLMISAAVVGVAAGYGAVLFKYMIEFFNRLAIGPNESILQRLSELPWWQLLIAMTAGGAIVGPLVYFLAREAKGHGVPEVMEAVALRGGKIRPRVVIVKALASAITLGAGGSVGREGPIVQIGSAAGSTVGQWLKVPREQLRVLVACGAAGGIAATFNAPIGGVIFAVEIILGTYAISALAPLVLSAVLATIIAHVYEGNAASFSIPSYKMVHPFEILPYILLAVLCAFVAFGFSRFLYWFEDVVNAIKIPDWLKTPIGFLLVGLMVLAFPNLFSVGYETIEATFRGEIVWWMLLSLAALKILASSLTLAAGGSGGVFAPSLFIGATFGGAYGYVIHQLFPSITNTPAPYAIVGMAAVVAGATHAPLTAFLIIFEMTNDYHLILPLMIGSLFASYITHLISKDNIYTLKLSRRGVDLAKGVEVSIMQGLKVDDVMNRDIHTLPIEMPFAKMMDQMLSSREINHYVVDHDGTLVGVISANNMKDMLSERDVLEHLLVAGDVADPMMDSAIPLRSSLADCMAVFEREAVPELPVVDDRKTRRFVGAINQRDIIAVYNREVMRRHAEEKSSTRKQAKQQG